MADTRPRVQVETVWLPTLNVELSGDGEGGVGDTVGRLLKPKVTLFVGPQRISGVAPYGEPGPTQWPKLRVGFLVVGGLLALFVVRRFLP